MVCQLLYSLYVLWVPPCPLQPAAIKPDCFQMETCAEEYCPTFTIAGFPPHYPPPPPVFFSTLKWRSTGWPRVSIADPNSHGGLLVWTWSTACINPSPGWRLCLQGLLLPAAGGTAGKHRQGAEDSRAVLVQGLYVGESFLSAPSQTGGACENIVHHLSKYLAFLGEAPQTCDLCVFI